MAKNIVLLSDGTGNSAAKLNKTNVWRLYQALDLIGGGQVALYDDGVGTSSLKPLALLGGAFGWGLKRNVLDLYEFLCRNYERGDRIYGFGFSRGAYTIRVLTGLIRSQGLIPSAPPDELHRMAEAAYRCYRVERYNNPGNAAPWSRILRRFLVGFWPAYLSHWYDGSRNTRDVKIEFLGLWDTVAAYGLPIKELTLAVDRWIWPLLIPDRTLAENVKRACHALSLDDERETFHPVLWREPGGQSSRYLSDERISQVWFAGVHSNVGGGYPDDSLAYVPLEWIMKEAASRGLKFRKGAIGEVETRANDLGRIYDSRRKVALLYRYGPRAVGVLEAGETLAPMKLHESVARRIKMAHGDYAPIVVPGEYAVATRNGQILPMTEGPLETSGQARQRMMGQEEIWRLVGLRRRIYVWSLIAIFFGLAFPAMPIGQDSGTCEGPLCFLSPPVLALGTVLPDFAGVWIKAFAANPGWMLIVVAGILASFVMNARCSRQIDERMAARWQASISADPDSATGSLPESNAYHQLRPILRYTLLPLAAILAAAMILFASANKVVFSVLSSTGAVCAAAGDPATSGSIPIFDTKSMCWASRVNLECGHRYEIALTKLGRWLDWQTDASPAGIREPDLTWLHYLGVPLRRYATQRWFTVIARIGRQGRDEYPLDFQFRESLPDGSELYTACLEARRDGELYLFVNDAYVALPGLFGLFYDNNDGTASVVVREIESDACNRPCTICPDGA